MDIFAENYIKQEPNSIEEEFITFIPPLPNAALVMPVKTEPFLSEHGSIIAVKNEPITDDVFLNTITPLTASVFNEPSKRSNTTSPLANGFVINELEPQQIDNIYLQDNNKIQNVPINIANSPKGPPPRLLNVNNKGKTTKCHLTRPRTMAVPSQPLQKRSLGTLLKVALVSTSTFAEPNLLNPKVKAKTNKILNTRQRDKSPQPESTLMLATKPVTPPILLNTQLRKRSKLTGNRKTETNMSNKKSCYAMEGSPKTCSGKLQKSEVKESNNAKTSNKRIINYIMQKKRVERIKKCLLNQTSTRGEETESNNAVTSRPSLKINLQNQQIPQDIVVKIEKLNADQNMNTIVQNTIPKETNNLYSAHSVNTSTSLNTFESVPTKEESVANILNQFNTIQMPALNTHPSSAYPVTPIITPESIGRIDNSETSKPSKTLSEIKVKCLCRLTGEDTSDDQSLNSKKDLKEFFHKMFEETRRLNKQQQRTVKMSLLQAICEAEEMVEKGKCCCF